MNRILTSYILPLIIMSFAFSSSTSLADTTADNPQRETITAKQIVQRMSHVYASCKSYRDSGVSTIVYFKPGGKDTERQPFATAFVRPDQFRFEYTSRGKNGETERYIVWAQDKDVRTWWDVDPGINKEPSIELSLAGATGVSGGSAHTIPALLMPEQIGGWRLTDIRDLTRLEDAELEGFECFCIQGKGHKLQPVTLWIDKTTFLVRRIDESIRFFIFGADQTTTYNPVINVDIDEEALKFNPTSIEGK